MADEKKLVTSSVDLDSDADGVPLGLKEDKSVEVTKDIDPELARDRDSTRARLDIAIGPVLTPEQLREKFKETTTKDGLRDCFNAFLRAWVEIPAVRSLMTILKIDVDSFASNFISGLSSEIDGDERLDDQAVIREFLDEFESEIFEKTNVFELEFPLELNEENTAELRHIAELVEIDFKPQPDTMVQGFLQEKIDLILELYQKEVEGVKVDDYIGGLNLKILDALYGKSVEKERVVEFYLALTEKGLANLRILEELHAVGYSTDEINDIDTEYLKLFLVLKDEGINTDHLRPKVFMNGEERVDKESIDLFCTIYGNSSYEIYSLDEIANFKGIKLSSNGIKSLRIFRKAEVHPYWENRVDIFNKLTDEGVEALEFFVGVLSSIYGDYEDKFEVFNRTSREQLEFLKSLKKAGFPQKILFEFVRDTDCPQVMPSPLSDEELKVVNFVFMDFLADPGYHDLRGIVSLTKRIQNSGITLEELRKEIEKIHTLESLGGFGISATMIVDLVLLAYGGRESAQKLYEAGLLKGVSPVGAIAGSFGSRDQAVDALVRWASELYGSGWDFDFNSIVDSGSENCSRAARVAEIFPECRFKKNIPEFAYTLSDAEWEILKNRIDKVEKIKSISEVEQVKRVIELVLSCDEKVFAEFVFLFRRIDHPTSADVMQVMDITKSLIITNKWHSEDKKKVLRGELSQLEIVHELYNWFRHYNVLGGIPDSESVSREQRDRIWKVLSRFPAMSGIPNYLRYILIAITLPEENFDLLDFLVNRTEVAGKFEDSENLAHSLSIMKFYIDGGSRVEQLPTLKKLTEFFPKYLLSTEYEIVPDVPLEGEIKWDLLRKCLSDVPELAKLEDLKEIVVLLERLSADERFAAEAPFFFQRTSGKLDYRVKMTHSLYDKFSYRDKLNFWKKLSVYFKGYLMNDTIPDFGDTGEIDWGRLEKRIESCPVLAKATDLKLIQGVLSLGDEPFGNLAYLLSRKWGFGNIDEWYKIIVGVGIYLAGDMVDNGELIEKSKSASEIKSRMLAKSLFGREEMRMEIFERILQHSSSNADVLLKNYAVYADNDDFFELAGFLLGPACASYRQSGAGLMSDYLEERQKLKDGDDEAVFFRGFAKEKFFDRVADFTEPGVLEEFWKLYPEYNFLNEVNEKNILFLVFVYANIRGEDSTKGEAKELRIKVRKLLSENKELALSVLNGLRDSVLADQMEGRDDDRKMIECLSEKPVPNYKIMERTIQYISMLLGLDDSQKELKSATGSLLAKFATKEKGSRKINYTNEDYAGFYEKSMGVERADLPALTQGFDALHLDRANFAFMQHEVMGAATIIRFLINGNRVKLEGKLLDGLQNIGLGMEKLKVDLGAASDPMKQKEILSRFRKEQQIFIEAIFAQTLGLQNLPEVTPELIEKIRPYLIYLSNIHHPDEKKRGIVSFFILLKILDKWEEFKRGDDIHVDEYLTDNLRERVHSYLKDRKVLDIFGDVVVAEDGDETENVKKSSSLAISEKNQDEWRKTMASGSEAILIAEMRGILDTMRQVETGYKDLMDLDNFDDMDKALFLAVQKFGARQVAASLANRFKNSSYSDEVIEELPLEGVDEKQILPALQKKSGIFGSLPVFVKAVEEANLEEKISFLEKAISPSGEVIEVFRKIGEEMTSASGVRPVSEDVQHLESILHKKKKELSAEEFAIAQAYIDKVRDGVLVLNKTRDELTAKFAVLHEAAKKIEIGPVFKSRLEEFRKVFIVDDISSKVTLKSTMVGDLVDVIPHVRQCLGCMARECNNDTNLTFGDSNRFLLITRAFDMAENKSLSDELVTVQITSEGDGERVAYSFIMDRVYEHSTRDVLVCNVLAVLEKIKKLKKLSPETAIDVFVTYSALSVCGVSENYLRDRLKAEMGEVKVEGVTKVVQIAQSASGDGHYEIGGGVDGRVSKWKGEVEGVRVSL